MSWLDTYSLPRTSRKIKCPGCGKQTFKPYVYTETGDPVDVYLYGRCDRQNDCQYDVKPEMNKEDKSLTVQVIYPKQDVLKTLTRSPSNLHRALAQKGIPEQFLYDHGILTTDHVDKHGNLIQKDGLTAFVFRNEAGKLCNVKYIKYKSDGKRDHEFKAYSLKVPPQRNEFVKEVYTIPLFGENELDKEKKKEVCVVESEKSRVIALFHYPEYDWVACSSANGLSDGSEGTADKITPLKGRTVYWVNDNDAAARGKFMANPDGKSEWRDCSSIRNGKKHITNFHICDLFKDREPGYDIGDALLDGQKPAIVPTWSKAETDPRYLSYIQPSIHLNETEYRGAIQVGESSDVNGEFDKVFRWMRGHVNAFYGWSKDGKSLMREFLSVNKSKKTGMKHCMFKQEDMGSYFDGVQSKLTADRIYDKLVWTLSGKTPFEHYAKENKCELLPWSEFMELRRWIAKHFFIVHPQDRKYKNIFDEFLFFHEVFGCDSYDIDPWNTVGLDDVERGDERLIRALVHAKEFALKTNTTVNIVNHPASRHEAKDRKTGAFVVVNQFMQLGGAAWDIKMDGQFSIHRPYRHKVANDPRVNFWNLNQRDSEIVGAERGVYKKIEFDRNSRRYFFDGVCPIDGTVKTPIKDDTDQQAEIPYTPSWRKKKKDKDFDTHVQQDWAQSTAPETDDLPF